MGAMLEVVVSLFLTYQPLLGYIFQAPQWLLGWWASDIFAICGRRGRDHVINKIS
jgi:hypothetical protein